MKNTAVNLTARRSVSFTHEKLTVSPYINRFTQPDSIIPNPGKPQAFNRFSYVYNRPIIFTDPTGHDAYWCQTASCQASYYTAKNDGFFAAYGVEVDEKMTPKEKLAIMVGIATVGKKFAETRGKSESAAEAFSAVYDPITINRVDSFDYTYTDENGNVVTGTKTAGCKTEGNTITCANFVNPSGYFQTSVNNIVHELGHVFDPVTVPGTGSSSLPDDFVTNATTILHDNSTVQWRVNTSGGHNEEFANFFVAWVYDVWGPNGSTTYSSVGTNPRNWMATNMSEWIP